MVYNFNYECSVEVKIASILSIFFTKVCQLKTYTEYLSFQTMKRKCKEETERERKLQ